jgi:dTDP-4-dehydrorhamnose reductase
MNDREKILVLGGSGFIGKQLSKKLGPKRAMATYHSKAIDLAVKFDALTMNVSDIIKGHPNISHAVILLWETDMERCAQDTDWSEALNIASIKRIIDSLNAEKIIPVFASTDYVFDGDKGDYTEEDTPNPIFAYGRQKAEMERYVQKKSERYLVLRLSKVVGYQYGDGSLFTNWLAMIAQGTPSIRCASDQTFSPVCVDDVVNGILATIEKGGNGIYHLGGPTKFKRIELLQMLLKAVGKYKSIEVSIEPCSIHDFPTTEKMPLDTSLKSDKIVKAFGLQFTDMEEVCRMAVDKYLQELGG